MLSSRCTCTPSCFCSRAALGGKIVPLFPLAAQGQPQGQKVAAEGHVLLPGGVGPGPLQQHSGFLPRPLQVGGLRVHQKLGPLAVAVGDFIVMGHTLVHFGQFFAQLPGGAVVHHQHRGGAEGPAAAVAQGDGRAAHLAAGAAVEAAHLGDVVVEQEALDEVALPQQVAPLGGGPLGVLGHGGFQQGFQLHHFGDLLPGEHPAHQHQNGQRVALQRFHRAAVQPLQQLGGAEGGKQIPCVRLDDGKGCVAVAAVLKGLQSVEVLGFLGIPAAIPLPDLRLPGGGQLGKEPLGALFHHVVEAEAHPVRQAGDKGVLLGEGPQHLLRVGQGGDSPGHLHRELIGQPHHSEEAPSLLGQGLQHGGGEHGVDVRPRLQQAPPLGQGMEVQVDGGEPPLAGAQQALGLGGGDLHAAAVGVGQQLLPVQAKAVGLDAVEPPPQPHHLLPGQKAVAAGHDKVDVLGQAVGQPTQKLRHPLVPQQVEIVQKKIVGRFAAQRGTQVLQQQSRAAGVGGAVVALQHRQPGGGKGLLHAFPEDGAVIRVDAGLQHHGPRLGLLCQEPAHRRRFTVAHGGHHRRERTGRYGPQRLPHSVRDVDDVQVLPVSGHARSPFPYAKAIVAHLRRREKCGRGAKKQAEPSPLRKVLPAFFL